MQLLYLFHVCGDKIIMSLGEVFFPFHFCFGLQIELPHWTDIVKTGRFKELAPYDPDWYYVRAASMARKIYLRAGLGVGGFQRIYGGSKRNGSCPRHFCKSSGAVARHILQQLQEMGIIELDAKGGRRITSSGQRDLDQVAGRIAVAP
uniref:40S ribosomal protein S19-1 n=1 Tax=Rhizophora mucronata TaxID=61149 RepID=A0A2P2KYP4_RHIMU